jgi:TP901 family phage tail tape measure protein
MANGFTLTANLNVATPNLGAVIQQIQRGLQGVNANVNLNIGANTGRQLTQINSQLADVGRQARSTGLDFEKFGSSAAQSLQRFAGFTAIASVFYTLSRAIKHSISDAIEFQHEVVKISQVSGISVRDLSNLTGEVTKLSIAFGVNSTKLLNAAQVLAQAGLTVDKTRIALEALAKSDISPTFDNIADTTEGVIAIMAQFKVEAEDLESTLSSLNSVAAKFAVESSDIITTVRRTGGAFEAAGGQLNELIALFTSVRATTRESAESIATGFRTIFTRIQRTRTIGFLDDLGIQLRDFEGKFIGPYKAIERLSNALKDLPSTDPRFSQIIEELGGFRQVSKVIPLIKEFGTAQQALQVAQRDNNSLTIDAEKANQSLLVRISKVKEEFQDLIRTIANGESFKNFANVALKLASSFIQVAKALEPLLPLIAGLGATKLGIGGIRSAGSFKKTLGFNKGGLVPGSGNGDTVPAMLEPGEFVIRKNAVQAIGAGNLHGMNAQRKNSGGQIVPKRFNFGAGVNPIGKSPIDKRTVAALFNGTPDDQKFINDLQARYLLDPNINQLTRDNYLKTQDLKSRAGKLIANYGDEIELRLTKKTRTQNKAENAAEKQVTKELNTELANALIPEHDRVFGSISLRPQGLGGPPKDGFTHIEHEGKQVPIPYKLYSVSLDKDTADNVIDNNFKPRVKKAIDDGAEQMRSFFSAKNKNEVFIQNENSILGGMFESSLLALGAPYKGKQNDDSTFDFPRGLGPLGEAKAFGTIGQRLANRPTDAKLNFGDSSEGDMTKKIKTYYRDKKVAGALRRAAGGNTPNNGTDTVPALLTPGEFVINKDAARSIGLGGLHQLNRADKVQKFAKGGAVQGFAGGGLVNAAGAGLVIAPLLLSLTGLTDSNNKLASSVSSAAAQFLTFKFLLSQAQDLVGGRFPSVGKIVETSRSNRANLLTERATSIANKDALTVTNRADTRKLNKFTRKQSALEVDQLALEQNIYNGLDVPKSVKDLKKNIEQQKQLKPRIVTQEQVVSQQNKAIDANNKATGALTARIRAENQTIKNLERYNTAISATETITLALGATLLAFGQSLQRSGEAELKAGNIAGGRDSIIAGSRLSGAGQGASIGVGAIGAGAAIGTAIPGIGTAIGAAVGTAIFAISIVAGERMGKAAGEKMATTLERQVRFEQAFKPFLTTMQSIVSDQRTASSAALTIEAGTEVLRRNLLAADVEGKESAKGNIDNASLQIEQFLNKLAGESESFAQFSQKAGKTLVNFATFLGKPASEVSKKYEEMIETQNKFRESQSNLAVSQERQLTRLRELNNLSSAVKDAVISLETFAVSLDSLDAFSGGGSGASKFVDRSEVFNRVGNVSNLSQFENIVKQTNQSLGPSSNNLSTELLDMNAALQQLPNIISQVVAESPNDSDNLQLRFDDALSNANIPSFIGNILKANLGAQLGPEQKSEKFFSEVRDNPSAIANKLVEGAFKPITDFFAEQSKILTEHNNKVANIFEKQRGVELKKLELNQKIINNNEAQQEFNAGINNTQFSLADARRNETTRRGSFGVANPNISAAGAGEEIIRLQQNIVKNELALQNTEGRARDELLQTLANERNAVDKLTNYLNFLGDAAQRNAGLLKAQAALVEERGVRRGIAEEFVFGNPDARRGLITGAAGAAQLAKTNDVNSVPAFAQGQSFDFLKRLGNVKLGILGGDSGEDVLKKTITKFLTSQGLGQNEAEQLAGLQVGGPEKLIVDAINANFADANKVARAQEEILKSIEKGLQDQRDAATKGFEIEKQNNKNDNRRREIGLEIGSLNAQQTDVRSRFNTLNNIKARIPNATDDRAFNVIQNVSAFEDIKKREDELKNNKFFDPLLSDNTKKIIGASKRAQTQGTLFQSAEDIKLLSGQGDSSAFSLKSIFKDLTGTNTSFLDTDNKLNESNFQKLSEALTSNLGFEAAKAITKSIASSGSITETDGLDAKAIFTTLIPALDVLRQQRNTDVLKLNTDKQELSQKTGLSINDIDKLLPHAKRLVELNNELGQTNLTTIKGFSNALAELTVTINNKKAELTNVPANQEGGINRANGGKVPGVGAGDKVRMNLTPGEFVMRREAVQAYGLEEMQRMNGMARGGSARLTPMQKREAYLASKTAKRKAFEEGSLRGANIINRNKQNDEKRQAAYARNIADRAAALKRIEIRDSGRYDTSEENNFDKYLPTQLGNKRVIGLRGAGAREQFAKNPSLGFKPSTGGDLTIRPNEYTPRTQQVSRPIISGISSAQAQLANPSLSPIARKNLEQYLKDKQRIQNRENPNLDTSGENNFDKYLPSRLGNGLPSTAKVGPAAREYFENLNIIKNQGANLAGSAVQSLFKQRLKFADGGFVPGQGNTDSVPAMLMPGEFVMNKAAVQTIGVDKLAKANRVNRANGSTSVEGMSNGTLTINPEISQVFSKFDVSVAKLATAIEAMPHTITMSVRHTMEVVFNGAEVFASLQPAFQDLAVKTVETKINQMIRDKFPDVGSMQ